MTLVEQCQQTAEIVVDTVGVVQLVGERQIAEVRKRVMESKSDTKAAAIGAYVEDEGEEAEDYGSRSHGGRLIQSSEERQRTSE